MVVKGGYNDGKQWLEFSKLFCFFNYVFTFQ